MTDRRAREDIGARLRRARARQGVSQRAFAAAIGMPLPSYRDYEGGKRIPGGEALRRLAQAGIDTGWLLTGQEPATGGRSLAVHESRASYGDTASWQASLDLLADRLREIITAVENSLEEPEPRLSPGAKADLVVALYEIYAESGHPPSATAVKRLVRGARSNH